MSQQFRRLGAVMAALAAVLLVVAGCSSSADDPSSGAQREYTDASGASVKIPEKPERVVTLSEIALDGALALGVTPVGTTSARGQTTVPAYLGDRAADIPIVASSGKPNLQAVLKLDPDLILVDDTTGAKNMVGELSKIAPTVVVGRYADDWTVYFTALADVLGRKEQHAKKVDEIDSQIASTTKAVDARKPAGRDVTASVVRWTKDGPTIVGGNSLSSWVLKRVGITRPENQEKVDSKNKSGQKVSLENLDQIDADYLFFGALGGKDQATKLLADARALPGFDTLGAVKSGHVYPVDGVPWTSASGPLGVQLVLTDISAAFTG